MKLNEIDSSEDDKEVVRKILTILPKKSQYEKYRSIGNQEQYWFDLTIPYSDWEFKKKIDITDKQAYRRYFGTYTNKLNRELGRVGFVAVAREMNIVVVRS